MTDLQYGEVVDIVITGAVVSGPVNDRILIGFGDDTLQMTPGNPTVAITRAEPADGLPQPGDIWRNQKGVTFAAITNRVSGVDSVDLLRVDGKGGQWPWSYFHKGSDGPIRLVYRLTDDPHYVPAADAATTPEASAPPGSAETGTPPSTLGWLGAGPMNNTFNVNVRDGGAS